MLKTLLLFRVILCALRKNSRNQALSRIAVVVVSLQLCVIPVQSLKSALEEEKVKGFAKAMSSVSVADGLSML